MKEIILCELKVYINKKEEKKIKHSEVLLLSLKGKMTITQ